MAFAKAFNAQTGPLIALILVVLISGCAGPNQPTQEEKKDEPVFFTEYRDTLVRMGELNQALATQFKLREMGKPIGVSGTPFWLITQGGWRLDKRNILLQGEAFKEGNDFYPNPIRRTEVEFDGPFNGIIKFDADSNRYSWLVQSKLESFSYQRTKNHHLIILEESDDQLDILDIETGQLIRINEPMQQIEDWALNESKETVEVLFNEGNGFNTASYPIAELLNTDLPSENDKTEE